MTLKIVPQGEAMRVALLPLTLTVTLAPTLASGGGHTRGHPRARQDGGGGQGAAPRALPVGRVSCDAG